MRPRQTIALLGGSFNPPHVAHVLAAAYVLSTQPVDALWVLPVDRHRLHKALHATFAQRLEMCRLAFGILPGVVVRDDERRNPSGATVDLLDLLQSEYPDTAFRLVIGTDLLAERHRWKDFDRLAQLAPPIILGRAGHAPDPAYADRTVPVVLPEVSSTAVRAALQRGQAVAGWLPREVVRYVAERGLYAP